MLPEIAAEALHFLTRRDIDKACGVSKWLDAMIAQSCDMYPLRPLAIVQLAVVNGFTPVVSIAEVVRSRTDHPFSSLDEASHFAVSIRRFSYVESIQFENLLDSVILRADHWKTLIDAIRDGAVRRLSFSFVDFSALNDDAFLIAVGGRGLQSLDVHRSIVPSRFVTDDLIRVSKAKGVLDLCFNASKSDEPHRFSDDAVLDFFFASDAAQRPEQRLVLEGIGTTDTLLTKFFERILSCSVRPCGTLEITGALKQRGTSFYAHYLSPDGAYWANATYRFPSTDDDDMSYFEVALSEQSSIYMHFYPVSHPS